MRSTFSARARKLAMTFFAAVLADAFAAPLAFADEAAPLPLAGELVSSSRTVSLPAAALSNSTVATITTGTVQLSADEASQPRAMSVIRASYVVDGCVYTFDAETGEFSLTNAVNARLSEEGVLAVPSALVLDGIERPISSIVPGVLSGCPAKVVAVSAAMASIDSDALGAPALASSEAAGAAVALQGFYVSPLNEAYASYDGALYGADSRSLLLIPGGRLGAVRIPSGAVVEDPEVFSHCASVDAIIVDADSAAFSPRSVEDSDEPKTTDDAVDASAAMGAPVYADDGGQASGTADLLAADGSRTARAEALAANLERIQVVVNDDAEAAQWRALGFAQVTARDCLSEADLADLLGGSGLQDSSAAAEASGVEDRAGSLDFLDLTIPEEAFAPVEVPSDDLAASEPTDPDSADGTSDEEGDADSTASPSEPAEAEAAAGRADSEPIEADAAAPALHSRVAFNGDLPNYLVTFDANGGTAGRIPDPVQTTSDGRMPSLLDQYEASKIPTREKYVFMGFYDGSDYRQATRYYNPDFTQDGCATDAIGGSGLVLYAGWAPVVSVDVPASVSVSVGSLSDVDAPTKTTATIKNLSPWDVKATSLTWDTASLEGSTSTLDHMFSNLSSLRFSVALADDPTQAALVAPGGTTSQATDIAHIQLAAGSTASPTEVAFDYTMIMNDAAVQETEAVSNTSLITVFEAVDAPAEAVRASVLFDINDDGASGYRLDAQEYTVGRTPPALRLPDGSEFQAPEYYGHVFMGFYDNPVYDAEGAVQYFDENGRPVREWDKASATVLYAGWSTERGRVVFDANGGYFNGDASKTALVYDVDYGATVASALVDGVPTAMFGSGSSLATSSDWYTDPLGGQRIDDFAEVVVENVGETITFYAHWSASSAAVPVTFMANGKNATVEGELSVTRSIKLGEFMESLPTAVRPGFAFAGWYTAVSGGIKIESAPPTLAPMTLYAHWTGNEVTVSWSTGGWDAADPPSATYTYADDDTINTGYPSGGIYDAMDRGAGYKWNGWYAMADDGAPSGSKITAASPLPIADAAYHAFWDVELSWCMNDGSDAAETTSVLLSTSALATLPAADPVRDGYQFEGWFTQATGGDEVTAATTVSGPTAFYAHWTPLSTPTTVTFDSAANGGSGGQAEALQISYGDDMPALSGVPVKTGYTFTGYYDAASGGTCYYDASLDANGKKWDKLDETATLYAQFQPKTSALTFNANGGTGTLPTGKVATYGSEMPEISNAPTRAGYVFQGYYDAESDGTQYYTAALTSARNWDKDTTEETTLYAQWKLVGGPSASTEEEAGDFYIYNGSAANGEVGYYAVSDIKEAANDISSKGTSSTYYALYRNLMNAMTDVKMTKSSTVYGYSTGWGDSIGGYFFRIIGINHDTKVAGGKAGLTFQFAGVMATSAVMNSSNTNTGGWGSSALRTRMNSGTIYGYVPTTIKNNWVQVKKEYGTTYNSTAATVSTSNDYLFLASYYELCGSVSSGWSSYQWLAKEGTQYEYYANQSITNSGSNARLVKYKQTSATTYNSSASSWWERSVYPNNSTNFLFVGTGGTPYNSYNASGTIGVVPCFCF